MPPRTPCSLGVQKAGGSARPEMPRYTGHAYVSFDVLTIPELITCSVVVYRFTLALACSNDIVPAVNCSDTSVGPHSLISCVCRKPTLLLRPRSTALYLTKSGPVYSRSPIASTSVISGSPSG